MIRLPLRQRPPAHLRESGLPGRGPAIIRSVSALRWSAGVMLLVAACFTEDPVPMASTTTDGPCTQGALSCGCYGNGTCDAGLACDPGAQLCIPAGCTPGELACRCDDQDGCNDDLACQKGICVQPGQPSTEGGSLDGDTTTAAMTETGPSSATDSGTTSGTTDPTDTTTGPPPMTTTTDGPECDMGPSCDLCIDCVDEAPPYCEMAYSACQGITGCITAAMCLRDCGLTGICFDDCCEGISMDAIDAAFELSLCRTDNCPGACGPYEFPTSCPP